MRRLLLLSLLLAACARTVVIDPDDVSRHNSPGWEIKRYPRAASPDAGPSR